MERSEASTKALEFLNRARKLLRFANNAENREAESCLQKALQLAPENLEVLQAAARFYDSASPNVEESRRYAMLCREKAAKIVAEMETILQKQGSGKQASARRMGGIIGPY